MEAGNPLHLAVIAAPFIVSAAAAIGVNPIKAFFIGLVSWYLVFVGAMSGFDSSGIAMVAGFGLFALVPAVAVLVVTTYIGYLIYRYL
jgi:hypothetical protein